ncbi:hypothetical protein T484DRAFT_1956952 [Baffinella frigidus]|nr:hypothetical protein T484DRAFT_1956952 [Cryptophyta sp. CCMP2293]
MWSPMTAGGGNIWGPVDVLTRTKSPLSLPDPCPTLPACCNPCSMFRIPPPAHCVSTASCHPPPHAP